MINCTSLLTRFHYKQLTMAILTQILPHRLHREALKQSATDPLSGKIDISILTTGLSSAARKKRVELAQALRKLIQAKGRVHTLNFQKLFQEMKDSSDLVGGGEGVA